MTLKLAAALAFIALNFYTFHNLATEDVVPPRTSFESFPERFDTWECAERIPMDDETIENLGVTDYLLCNYQDVEAGQSLNLYVGYHAIQRRSDSGEVSVIHPPEHCLPGSGWDIIDSEIIPIDFGVPGEAKRVTIAKGQNRQLVYFWYQSRGHAFARDWERLYRMFVDRALRGRTDVTIPLGREGGPEAADQIFQDFAAQALSGLDPYVPR
jgi:EpsI family protein